ncbi:hypothetical protein OAL55_03230 [Verrucomicrobiales bacterium]|nr:hypothetical protein [Verrucomicrobiales bacterium]
MLAFEHQGQQHYQAVKVWGVTEKVLRQRKRDDRKKQKLCAEHGITLIEVPGIPDLLPLEELRDFIQISCEKAGYTLANTFGAQKISVGAAYKSDRATVQLEKLKTVAFEHGGELVSNDYISVHSHLLWECAEGHRWEATPNNILRSRWCPTCRQSQGGDKRRTSVEEFHALAEQKGGFCLSKEYSKAEEKLRWQCSKGHIWEAKPAAVKSGTWCPACAGKRIAIDDMRSLAKQRKGKCLSEIYGGVHGKLEWECEHGHQWRTTPRNINRGTWCPVCNVN